MYTRTIEYFLITQDFRELKHNPANSIRLRYQFPGGLEPPGKTEPLLASSQNPSTKPTKYGPEQVLEPCEWHWEHGKERMPRGKLNRRRETQEREASGFPLIREIHSTRTSCVGGHEARNECPEKCLKDERNTLNASVEFETYTQAEL